MPRIQVSVGGTLATVHNWSINYNFSTDSLPSASDLLSAANAIMASISGSATVKAMLGTSDTFSQVRLTGYTGLSGPAAVTATSTASAVVGTASLAVSPQVCVVASLRTVTPGRSYRGRLYVPLRAYAVTADGSVSGTVAGDINTVVQDIAQFAATALAGVSVAASWVVYSKTVPAMTPVTQVSIGNRVDTQRRRVEGRETYTNFSVT